MSEIFTIVGGAGFIGSNLASFLAGQNTTCFVHDRLDPKQFEGRLGHVLYCAGTTSDFRHRPFDTIDAHVSALSGLLKYGDFDSLTYLSSTRVYIHSDTTSERAVIYVHPSDPDDLFNISKIAGESLCFQSGRRNVRAIRVSNVLGEDFGSRNFLFDLMREALLEKQITLRSSYTSEKDYIHISDVAEMIVAIARSGTQQLYNLASGTNLTNKQIVEQIRLEISG